MLGSKNTPFETHEIEQIYLQKLKQLNYTVQQYICTLDIGSGAYRGENQVENYNLKRLLGREVVRITIDMFKISPHILADASEMPFRDESFDIVFLESVLEHVTPPLKLTRISEEVYRILRKNGLVLGWVPYCFPYHGSRDMPDVTRFTKEGVNTLFNHYNEVIIEPMGGPISIFIKSIALPDVLRTLLFQRLESKIRRHVRSESLPAVGFRFIAVKKEMA